METHNNHPEPIVADALMVPRRAYFFSDGIFFECKNCGTCCTGEPGTVYVNEHEINTIAEYLGITATDAVTRYLYPYKDSYSIKEDESNACCFYENGCTIYTVRPKQCRTYPFWFRNLRSEDAWHKTSSECPGIGQGRFYSADTILDIVCSTI